MSAATLKGCYSLQLVGVGKGPMAIAAVRLPTHIRLDTTKIAGTSPEQYAARDISPAGERVDNTYHWRPTGLDTFELIVIRDGAVETFPAGIGAAGTAAQGPSRPMPAGAPVRLAAVVEACR